MKFDLKKVIIVGVLVIGALTAVACDVEEIKNTVQSEVEEAVEGVVQDAVDNTVGSAEETIDGSINAIVDEVNDLIGNETFTLEELAAFDGKDGNAAYVAVDGVVYDVTDVGGWSGGEHNGNFAGTDVTEAIGSAPHGVSKLDGLTVVGKIKE